jgi:hypothetical protein
MDLMSTTKSPVMIMTLKSETEFPKALKNLMLSMGMQGEAVYKGFPMIDKVKNIDGAAPIRG